MANSLLTRPGQHDFVVLASKNLNYLIFGITSLVHPTNKKSRSISINTYQTVRSYDQVQLLEVSILAISSEEYTGILDFLKSF